MIKISKQEMLYLTSKGVRYGEDGIIATTGHHKTWYVTESRKCMTLLDEYQNKYVK